MRFLENIECGDVLTALGVRNSLRNIGALSADRPAQRVLTDVEDNTGVDDVPRRYCFVQALARCDVWHLPYFQRFGIRNIHVVTESATRSEFDSWAQMVTILLEQEVTAAPSVKLQLEVNVQNPLERRSFKGIYIIFSRDLQPQSHRLFFLATVQPV